MTGPAVLPIEADLDLNKVTPEFHRAKKKDGSWGKVHVVVAGVTVHDIKQGTKPESRWPWFHKPEVNEVKRVSTAEFVVGPRCVLCENGLDGVPLKGYV